MDGSSFMGSRLRIEHARDSRDSRRDGGRWSPPRGRFSWVTSSTHTLCICQFWCSWWPYCCAASVNKVISYCSPDFTLISIFYWTFLQSWQPSWPKDRLSHDCWEPQFSHQLAGPQGFHAQGLIKHLWYLNTFFLNVMNLTLRDSHDPPCVIILTKISNYPTPPQQF